MRKGIQTAINSVNKIYQQSICILLSQKNLNKNEIKIYLSIF